MSGKPLPADDVSVTCVAGRGVVGGEDRLRRGRQPRPVVLVGGAPAQAALGVAVVVLHHDLAQGLDAGPERVVCPVPVEVLQEPDGVVAGGVDPGLRPARVLAQAERAAVAASPLLVDQGVQQVPGGAGDLLQRGTYRLGDQLQPGQVTHRGQDMGGIGALRGALPHQPGLLETGQCEVEEAVGPVALGETVAEVGRHAVVEAGIVQLHSHGVLEVDAAADRLGGLTVRQAEPELQDADGGQLGGREARAPVARVPVGEVLVTPQPMQPVSHPYRRRAVRVARPRDLRGPSRDLLTGTGTERQRTPRRLHRYS